MNRRILHIMPHEKWTSQVIACNNRNFAELKHRTFLYTLNKDIENKVEKTDDKNIIWGTKMSCFKQSVYFMWEILQADVVIFHSLFLPTYLLWLCNIIGLFQKQKYSWLIWGGDIYNELWAYQNNPYKIKTIIRESARRIFIWRLPEVIAGCYMDYVYLKKNYKTRAKYVSAGYIMPLLDKKKIKYESNDEIRILIGNNASDTCNHIETMKIIYPYVDNNTKIYVIMSYPKVPVQYKQKVIKKGRELFGDNFIVISQFMAYDEYIDFLNNIDIAIMNHNRQQGVSNVKNLIYMGKKVYLSSENTYLYEMKKRNVEIYEVDKIDNTLLKKICNKSINRNQQIMEKMQSDKEYVKRWKKIYYKNHR